MSDYDFFNMKLSDWGRLWHEFWADWKAFKQDRMTWPRKERYRFYAMLGFSIFFVITYGGLPLWVFLAVYFKLIP